MNKYLLGSLLLAASAQSYAAPMAFGWIESGTTFSSSSAFNFTNTSTSGEKIVKLSWDLTPINGFFDSTSAAPGLSPSPISVNVASDPVGAIFPTDASLNGQSILSVDFTSFDVGETLSFGVDTDLFSAIDAAGIDGEDFVGAIVTAWFDNGQSTFGTYTLSTLQGIGTEVNISTPGLPSVPVPAAAFLFAPALLGFMGLRRKAKKA